MGGTLGLPVEGTVEVVFSVGKRIPRLCLLLLRDWEGNGLHFLRLHRKCNGSQGIDEIISFVHRVHSSLAQRSWMKLDRDILRIKRWND